MKTSSGLDPNLKQEEFISVVVPVYRAVESLPGLYIRLANALKPFLYELIFVDDFSDDASFEILRDISSQDKRVITAQHPMNMGQDNAILTGLKLAKGDYAVILDDDLQHKPEDIVSLLDKCRNGADVCYGNFKYRKHIAWKRAGSKVNDIAAGIFLKKPSGLYLSPFKVINRKVIDRIIDYKGMFFYTDAVILTGSFKIEQVFLEHQQSLKNKSAYTFNRSIHVFLNHLICSANYNRLNFALGSAVIGIAVIMFFRFQVFPNELITAELISAHFAPTLLILVIMLTFGVYLLLFLLKNIRIYLFKINRILN